MYILIKHLLFNNVYDPIEVVYTIKKVRLTFIYKTRVELILFNDI